ncbi:MAG: hypothetical protein PHU99_02575 [Candidatus Cloacimonetes bacterium]|nr:hypothetical protein [Candidatus Cloacimonadota bacterium]MDY0336359.1 hypothetical protein [Candidatus Cloacimonadaceae bacterium]MCK9334992.1 hypothetical protein [Candidatus Cloacimonadota bacterium]MDD2543210.1 hypothetical protein [Candidatus Cloacimonadota bacterium]MDD2683125.1 hypothetical protein [Candidatus Cloacimonadota bacterium]
MKKVLFIALVVSLVFLMAACGSNKPKGPKAEGELVYRPTWWSSQNEADYVCTYGQGTNLSETSSMNTAKANALQEAAQYVEVEVQSMIKSFEEEAGVYNPQLLALSSSVVKAVSSARFSGTVTGKVETRKVNENGGERYKTWMQIKIPKSEIMNNLMTNIKNEEALYNQFKASQAFQELERELQKD